MSFFYVFIMILFNLVFLVLERHCLDSLNYVLNVFLLPRIILGINVFFSLDVFTFDRVNIYASPFIGLVFILEGITVKPGLFTFGYVLTTGFVYPYDVTD